MTGQNVHVITLVFFINIRFGSSVRQFSLMMLLLRDLVFSSNVFFAYCRFVFCRLFRKASSYLGLLSLKKYSLMNYQTIICLWNSGTSKHFGSYVGKAVGVEKIFLFNFSFGLCEPVFYSKVTLTLISNWYPRWDKNPPRHIYFIEYSKNH